MIGHMQLCIKSAGSAVNNPATMAIFILAMKLHFMWILVEIEGWYETKPRTNFHLCLFMRYECSHTYSTWSLISPNPCIFNFSTHLLSTLQYKIRSDISSCMINGRASETGSCLWLLQKGNVPTTYVNEPHIYENHRKRDFFSSSLANLVEMLIASYFSACYSWICLKYNTNTLKLLLWSTCICDRVYIYYMVRHLGS